MSNKIESVPIFKYVSFSGKLKKMILKIGVRKNDSKNNFKRKTEKLLVRYILRFLT